MKQEHIVEYIVDGDDLIYNDNHGRLVRCKDCKYLNEDSGYCDTVNGCPPEDFFCRSGRENDR